MFYKIGVLKNFAKFTGKHLCWSLFFNKFGSLRPATLLEKRRQHSCFPVNFAKFLRTPFFIEHLWWLLLVNKLNVSVKIFSSFKLVCLFINPLSAQNTAWRLRLYFIIKLRVYGISFIRTIQLQSFLRTIRLKHRHKNKKQREEKFRLLWLKVKKQNYFSSSK